MDNNTIKKLKRSLRLKLIFVIAIFLSFNTFAWFIYSSKVENSITAHVRAWRIEFEGGDNGNFEYINFDIENIFPGMPDYSNFINIVNHGESVARITYEIDSVRILDEEYSIEDYPTEEMLNILRNNYPFLIEFELTNDELNANSGSADFKIKVMWAYESGNDELDTYFGNKSYEFKQNNPDKSGISIVIKITANQST